MNFWAISKELSAKESFEEFLMVFFFKDFLKFPEKVSEEFSKSVSEKFAEY